MKEFGGKSEEERNLEEKEKKRLRTAKEMEQGHRVFQTLNAIKAQIAFATSKSR